MHLGGVQQNRFHRGFLLAAAIIVAVIVYGSLYPFNFHRPADGVGPIQTLLKSWAQAPQRADFLANILFYLPFGCFAVLAIAGKTRALPAICLAAITGALLSTAM